MKIYVEKNNMQDRSAWGTELEIQGFATTLQIDVHVYTDHGSKHACLRFKPCFSNANCNSKSDLDFTYSIESRDHYDRVVPCLSSV